MSKFKLAAVAVLAVIVGFSMSVQAATQTLLNGVNTGGWTASAPDSANVGLQVLGVINGTLYLKKHAVFGDNEVNPAGFISPIPITFLKGNSGVNRIVIDFEEIGNETGYDWSSFSMTLLGNASYDASSINFNASPFAHNSISADGKTFTADQGVLHDGQSFFPGFGKGAGDLVINATGSFSLNEQPGITVAVPLPAAAWTGLSGLLGLGLLGSAKKFRKLVA